MLEAILLCFHSSVRPLKAAGISFAERVEARDTCGESRSDTCLLNVTLPLKDSMVMKVEELAAGPFRGYD